MGEGLAACASAGKRARCGTSVTKKWTQWTLRPLFPTRRERRNAGVSPEIGVLARLGKQKKAAWMRKGRAEGAAFEGGLKRRLGSLARTMTGFGGVGKHSSRLQSIASSDDKG